MVDRRNLKRNHNDGSSLPFRYHLRMYFKYHQLGFYHTYLNTRGSFSSKHFNKNCHFTRALSETYELVKVETEMEILNSTVTQKTIERLFSLDPFAQAMADTLNLPWEGFPEDQSAEDPFGLRRIISLRQNEIMARFGLIVNTKGGWKAERHTTFDQRIKEEKLLLASRILNRNPRSCNYISPKKTNEVLRIGVLFDLLKMEAPLGFMLKYCEEDYRHYVRGQ
jgi:hypothetical protein